MHSRASPLLKQTLESHSSLQVVLIPVGDISPSRFTEFSKKITEFSVIPLQNLTRPGGYSHERSPFKEFSWDNGALYFNFCDNPDEVRNPWEDYQGHRRTLAAIGICDCPSCDDLPGAYREFDKAAGSYRHVKYKKLFAFDHSFHGNMAEETAGLKDLVMFPEDQIIGEGMSSVNLHMMVVLNTMAVTLIQQLENDILAMQQRLAHGMLSEAYALRTGLDEGEKNSTIKKRQSGRLRKWIGDYCLLACSPGDAMTQYGKVVGKK